MTTYNSDSDSLQNFFSLFIFVAYFYFAVFGGAGYAFQGMELLKSWVHRPQMPIPEEHVLSKTVLKEQAERIIQESRMVYDLNTDFKRRKSEMGPKETANKSRIMMKTIRQIKAKQTDFYEMKKIYECEDSFENENPLTYITKVVIGVVFLMFGFFNALNNYYIINYSYIVNDTVYFTIRSFTGQGIIYLLLLVFFTCGVLAMLKGYQNLARMTPSWMLSAYSLQEDHTWTDDMLHVANILLIFGFGMCTSMARQMTALFNKTGLVECLSLGMSSIVPYSRVYEGIFFNAVYILFFLIGFIITLFQLSPRQKLRILLKDKKEDLRIQKQILDENPGIV